MDDSLDSNDVPFSQELLLHSSSSEPSEGRDTTALEVSNTELQSLCNATRVSRAIVYSCDSGGSLCEDIQSRLFADFDDERYVNLPWENFVETEDSVVRAPVSEEELGARAQSQQNGRLSNWDYDSPFSAVEVKVDDVDTLLGDRFVREANKILEYVMEDIKSRDSATQSAVDSITPMQFLETFLTDCLLEKLVCFANRALSHRQIKPTNRSELQGIVILMLCARCTTSHRRRSVILLSTRAFSKWE